MAEKEYREREAAKKVLADDYAYAAAKLLDTVPTADVQEVRHGKWIYVDGVLDWANYKCSKCGYIQKFGDDTCFYNYCPNCGAKMG